MEKHVYIYDEFLEKAGASPKQLQEWEDLKLILPTGFTDEKIPCYDESTIEKVHHIQKLIELGYGADEITKIVRKVGLPGQSDGKADVKDAGQYLTVGNLAEKVGVSPRTIKHWETKGIIEADMRSVGGFRLYSDSYVYLCRLLLDLQLFGYSLDEIKLISDYFREFISLRDHVHNLDTETARAGLNKLQDEISSLSNKIGRFKSGIRRWEDLLKKQKKEIVSLANQLEKREKEKAKKKDAKKQNR